MSATGLEVFDKTLHTTNLWLKEIGEEIGEERRGAYHSLGAVLRALRDRLTIDEAAQLSAQLPLLARGIYFDQWRPAEQPTRLSGWSLCAQAKDTAALLDVLPPWFDDDFDTIWQAYCRPWSGTGQRGGASYPPWLEGAAAALTLGI
jgi:hypothetical protein